MCDIRSISRFVLAVRRNSSDMILYFSSAMFYMIVSPGVLKCYHSVFSCGLVYEIATRPRNVEDNMFGAEGFGRKCLWSNPGICLEELCYTWCGFSRV